MLKSKLGDYEERLAALEHTAAGVQAVSVEDVVQLEKELLTLRAKLAQSQGQVKAYEGLPPNKDAARKEIKRLETELEGLKRERDRIFADMVGE